MSEVSYHERRLTDLILNGMERLERRVQKLEEENVGLKGELGQVYSTIDEIKRIVNEGGRNLPVVGKREAVSATVGGSLGAGLLALFQAEWFGDLMRGLLSLFGG